MQLHDNAVVLIDYSKVLRKSFCGKFQKKECFFIT